MPPCTPTDSATSGTVKYSTLLQLMMQQLPFVPNDTQQRTMAQMIRFACAPDAPPLMLLNGYAGTGKTSLIASFARMLRAVGRTVILLAPTGRAAKVLSDHVGAKAYTIHKQIYRRKSSTDAFSSFQLNFNKYQHAVFIVDEASMIGAWTAEHALFGSGNLIEDLMTFADNHRSCRVLLSGDTAQLPPVGLEHSPALDEAYMKQYSSSLVSCQLTEVARQAEGSGILTNATMLRRMLAAGVGDFPALSTASFEDIRAIPGSELMELLADCYDRRGLEETMVICHSNRRANRYNEGIRNRILYREEELTSGDVLMVVRNNYYWAESSGLADEVGFIANGDTIRIRRIRRLTERYGFHFAEADVILTDYDQEISAMLLIDTLHSEQAALSVEDQKRLYSAVLEDYAGLPRPKQREAMSKDPFYNALQVKYAYAVTGHKSQGGQWHTVFIDNGWYQETPPDTAYLRWLYTALTRATDTVYLVNFPKNFLTME